MDQMDRKKKTDIDKAQYITANLTSKTESGTRHDIM